MYFTVSQLKLLDKEETEVSVTFPLVVIGDVAGPSFLVAAREVSWQAIAVVDSSSC
jgi:hypothetical protein